MSELIRRATRHCARTPLPFSDTIAFVGRSLQSEEPGKGEKCMDKEIAVE
jgi:hypothetical protein